MIISIERSFQYPQNIRDIDQIYKQVSQNSNYTIVKYLPNNFISFHMNPSQKLFRLHQDGRIFIECATEKNECIGNVVELFQQLEDFTNNNSTLVNENQLNPSFIINIIGVSATALFWELHGDIEKIGRSISRNSELRTYANPNFNSISIRIEPN
ncbi:hypothetical protein [Methanoregula sp. UBA64]|jgi:hypothetical protein|uniref:hypothetical protein n=1 Tax=Methanoregula sp. UBA64 TaxID=1915554 RepID=UPI0025CCFE2A|nr:hypothetical protein [Methanoregula sp. UBA64]